MQESNTPFQNAYIYNTNEPTQINPPQIIQINNTTRCDCDAVNSSSRNNTFDKTQKHTNQGDNYIEDCTVSGPNDIGNTAENTIEDKSIIETSNTTNNTSNSAAYIEELEERLIVLQQGCNTSPANDNEIMAIMIELESIKFSNNTGDTKECDDNTGESNEHFKPLTVAAKYDPQLMLHPELGYYVSVDHEIIQTKLMDDIKFRNQNGIPHTS